MPPEHRFYSDLAVWFRNCAGSIRQRRISRTMTAQHGLAPFQPSVPLPKRTHEPSAACSMTMRVSSTREAMLSLRKAWRRWWATV
jgi:hypothetical protein